MMRSLLCHASVWLICRRCGVLNLELSLINVERCIVIDVVEEIHFLLSTL